jgi:hypothetical protein
MAPKAARKTSTRRWLPLREACNLEPLELLVRKLAEKKAWARGLSKDGILEEIPGELWGLAVVNREENSARSRFLTPVFHFYAIEVLLQADVTEAASAPKAGAPPTYDHAAIKAAAEDVLKAGTPDLKSLFYEKLYKLCGNRHIKMPSDRQLRRIAGPLYDSRRRSTMA